MARLEHLAVLRLEDTIASLNAKLLTATQNVAQHHELLKHAQDVALFAQEVLAVVSHDIRNPLNSIMLSAQAILAIETEDAPAHKAASRIVASALAASRLINDLLDYSQARLAGGIRIERSDANLHDLAYAAVDEMEFAKRGHSVQLHAEGAGVGRFDPDRVSQVLLNLIANAFSHSPDGSAVDVATIGNADTFVIRVHNANREVPIAAGLMATIFQPFKSGSTSSGSHTRSVGLGLYIVDQIVKAHGGNVGVASNDQGTTFTVTFGR